MMLSAFMFSLLSWLRAAIAGGVAVDGHAIDGAALWITFVSFLAALAASAVALYRLWRSGELSMSQLRIAAYALVVVYSLMLPMLSNDLFSLLSYGDAANKGVDVYTDTGALRVSSFFSLVGPLWRQAPCVYGPVCLTTSRIATLTGGGNVIMSIVAYKVLAIVWAAVFIEFMLRVGALLRLSAQMLALILLNPIFMIQGVGQLHCDAIAIALVAGLLYTLVSGRWYAAFVFAGLAIGAKMSYVLMLPFLIGGVFLLRSSWSQFFMRITAGLIITFTTLSLLYLPYYTSGDTFAVPFKFLALQNPAKSAAEIIGDIVYFAPAVVTGHNEEVNSSIQRPSGVSDGQLRSWLAVKMILQVFALVVSIVVLLRFWRGDRTFMNWCRNYVRLLLLFLLFYSHVLYPWYLLFILPLLLQESDVRFVQWLLVMLGLAVAQDTMTFARHDTIPYYIILVLTFISTMSFFWRFRTVYFRSLSENN
ncbi:MAG: hypothetical protein JST83_14410 [Bacteroidetes bacterium]|nr:hypothetical protein [Bacteroidota bacterium]